jgi:hypothetical protein
LNQDCEVPPTKRKRLSSFGELSHFKPSHKPVGAADRCLDCALASSDCHYSATKYYLEKLKQKYLEALESFVAMEKALW